MLLFQLILLGGTRIFPALTSESGLRPGQVFFIGPVFTSMTPSCATHLQCTVDCWWKPVSSILEMVPIFSWPFAAGFNTIFFIEYYFAVIFFSSCVICTYFENIKLFIFFSAWVYERPFPLDEPRGRARLRFLENEAP
jgi:hypothetical protein